MIKATIIFVLVLFAATGGAWSQERHGGGGRHWGGGQGFSGQRGGFGGMQRHDWSRGGGNWARMGHSQWHGYGRGYYGRDFGAGVLGGFLGGIVGTWWNRPEPQVVVVPQEPIRDEAWCIQRYRSYDPYTRTYLGFDGLRHGCP